MIYNLSNPLDVSRIMAKVTKAIQRGVSVELVEKRQRTLNQNAYLHVLLGFLALETGNTIEYVKRVYFKQTVNPDMFVTKVNDVHTGKEEVIIMSSASLTADEMTIAITRLRNWASQELGIYLPSADDKRILELMEIEVNKHQQWIR